MSELAAQVIGLFDGEFFERTRAIDGVRRRPASADVQALRAFLWFPFGDQSDLDSLSFHSLKNDILNALIDVRPLPEGLGEELLALYAEPGLHPTMRDYILQHLPRYIGKRWPSGAPPPGDPDAEAVLNVLWEAAEDASASYAGTALNALHALYRSEALADADRLANAAVAVVLAPGANELAIISALQIAARLGLDAVLPRARQLAERSGVSTLRISAIAALGYLGETTDCERVQAILQDGDPSLHAAAEGARRRLASRGYAP